MAIMIMIEWNYIEKRWGARGLGHLLGGHPARADVAVRARRVAGGPALGLDVVLRRGRIAVVHAAVALRVGGQARVPGRLVAPEPAAAARLRGLPVQVSVGRGDMFYGIDRTYATALREQGVALEWHTGVGAHSQKFWRTFVPRLLRFTAAHLTG